MLAILKTDLEQFQKVRGSKYERILHDLTNAQLEMSLPDGVNCKNLWGYLRTEADILADFDSAIQWARDISESDCTDAQDYTNSYIGSNERNVAGCYNCICRALRSEEALGLCGEDIDRESMTIHVRRAVTHPTLTMKHYAKGRATCADSAAAVDKAYAS